jgi:hypothetical protein
MPRPALALISAALMFVGTSSAQSPDTARDIKGTWVWEVEGRNLFVLKLEVGPRGLQGSLQRPAHMTFSMSAAGVAVSGIQMPVETSASQVVRQASDGQVLRTTGADGSIQEFVIRTDGKGALLLRVDPNPAAPTLTMIRPRDPAAVATDWKPDISYSVHAGDVSSNPELTAIFEVDQADRKDGLNTDWAIVAPRDKVRRARVKQMLGAGELRSADDFYHAAFVFQHGDEASDYLLAHVLAMAAQGKGQPQAGWIAMATLDRYLQKVGQSQVLGTQSVTGDGGKLTKGLYDEELIPDSLRVALGVPTRAQEAAQRAAMEAGGENR